MIDGGGGDDIAINILLVGERASEAEEAKCVAVPLVAELVGEEENPG